MTRIGSRSISRLPLLAASRARATAESILPIVIIGAIALMVGGLDDGYLTFGLIAGPLCAMIYAARARLERSSRGHTLRAEAIAGAAVAATPSVAGACIVALSGVNHSGIVVGGGLLVWNAMSLATFRALAWQWPRWTLMRRRSLRWQMTHTAMLSVAAAATVAIAVTVVAVALFSDLRFGDGPSPTGGQRLVLVLLAVGASVFLSVVALGLMLPIAAAVSSASARSAATRLERLADGTGRIAEGDLAARVERDGEDEIARMQADFNAMASALERSVDDLRKERQRVERLLAAQRELVASVSHELRTPIATARGYLEAATGASSLPVIDGVGNRDLEIARRELERLTRLVDDLFDLARAETGQLQLSVEPVDLAPIVQSCVDAVSPAAWRSGRVEVVSEVDTRLPEVHADTGRLEQVLRNLLHNAVRHTPPGGVVAVSATAAETKVTIEVTDTGGGVPADQLDRIFDRFHRLEPARRRDDAGAGLGLALVKELAEAMGGSVTVESEPDHGTCFAVTLLRAG